MSETNNTSKVVVTVSGRDVELEMSTLGVTMESSEREILDAVAGVIQENLRDSDNEYSFTVRKVTSQNLALVFPKPVAGQ